MRELVHSFNLPHVQREALWTLNPKPKTLNRLGLGKPCRCLVSKDDIAHKGKVSYRTKDQGLCFQGVNPISFSFYRFEADGLFGFF